MNRNIRLSKQAWDGLDFVVEMFTGYDHIFPRNILTGATRRPYIIHNRDEAMTYFEAALYEDCYMNAYPNYEAIGILGCKTPTPTFRPVPNHIMIDIDAEPFNNSPAELETALADTLRNIKASVTGISSEHHIVIASGSGGYHVHVPLPGWTTPLQEMPEFEAFKDDPDLANKFLRFAERRLSNNKADHRHNPSIRSCLFRMPGTINTKAKKVVRIVQGMGCLMDMSVANRSCAPPFIANESWGRPTTQFLNDFHAYLVQQQINDKITKSDRRLKQMYFVTDISSNKSHDHGIWWIDKLLQIGVEDYRKDLLYWVLAPYLITVRKMDHDKATAVLEEWLEKCNAIRSLQPGWSYFRYRINYCIDNAYRNERLPIKFQTFQEYYPDLI